MLISMMGDMFSPVIAWGDSGLPSTKKYNSELYYTKHLRNDLLRKAILNLKASNKFEIKSCHHGSLTTSSVESIEERYLLVGGIDSAVSLYDLGQLDSASLISSRIRIQNISKSKPHQTELNSNISVASTNSHKFAITSIQWYPIDNGAFLSSSFDHTIKLWDTSRFSVVATFELGHKITNARIHGDGKLVAVCIEGNKVKICDLQTGNTFHQLTGHRDYVTAIDWNPLNPNLLVSGAKDGTVRIWDIRRGGSDGALFSLDSHQDHTFSRYSASTTSSSVMGMRSSSSFRVNWKSQEASRAHQQDVVSLNHSPSGNFIISAGNDKRIRVWDSLSGRLLSIHIETNLRSRLPYRITSVPFNMNGDDILMFPWNENGDIGIIPLHTRTGRVIKALTGSHFETVVGIDYISRSQQVVSAGRDGLINVWDPHFPQTEDEDIASSGSDSRRGPSTTYGDTSVLPSAPQDDWSDEESRDGVAGGAEEGEGRVFTNEELTLLTNRGARAEDAGWRRGGRGQGRKRARFQPPILQNIVSAAANTSSFPRNQDGRVDTAASSGTVVNRTATGTSSHDETLTTTGTSSHDETLTNSSSRRGSKPSTASVRALMHKRHSKRK